MNQKIINLSEELKKYEINNLIHLLRRLNIYEEDDAPYHFIVKVVNENGEETQIQPLSTGIDNFITCVKDVIKYDLPKKKKVKLKFEEYSNKKSHGEPKQLDYIVIHNPHYEEKEEENHQEQVAGLGQIGEEILSIDAMVERLKHYKEKNDELSAENKGLREEIAEHEEKSGGLGSILNGMDAEKMIAAIGQLLPLFTKNAPQPSQLAGVNPAKPEFVQPINNVIDYLNKLDDVTFQKVYAVFHNISQSDENLNDFYELSESKAEDVVENTDDPNKEEKS